MHIEDKEEVLIIKGQRIHFSKYREISDKLSTLRNTSDHLIQLMEKAVNDEFQLSEDLHSQALALKLINSNGAMEREVKLVLAHQADVAMTDYVLQSNLQSSIKTFYSSPQSYKIMQKAFEKTCHSVIEQKLSETKEDSKEEEKSQVNNYVTASELLQLFRKSKIDRDKIKELEKFKKEVEKFTSAIKEEMSADEDKNESSWFSSCSLQ